MGLGKGDIAERALELAKHADEVLVEKYSSFLEEGYAEWIEQKIGKELKEVSREGLEQLAEKTVEMAREKDVVLLTPGDPLVATTHKILLDIAEEKGIKTKVVHAPSAFSVAIGESRLSFYKFGPVVNIPYWQEHYKPTAFAKTIARNLELGLHSLAFLDINRQTRKPMKIEECIEILGKADAIERTGIFKKDPYVLIEANLGRDDQQIMLTKLSLAAQLGKMLEGKVLTLIFLSRIGFDEEGVKNFEVRNYQ
jgi:diphthine synthase